MAKYDAEIFQKMKITFYSCKEYERPFINSFVSNNLEFDFVAAKLTNDTIEFSKNSSVVSVFSRDDVSRDVIRELAKNGVKLITTRSAGFNHIDLKAANDYNILVSNVPSYSPEAIAEHAILLMLALSRKVIEANKRIENNNFSLNGLLGFNLSAKTIGIIGTGRIGQATIRILSGFGANIIAYDIFPNTKLLDELNFRYVSLEKLYRNSDIISLHLPLTKQSKYIINNDAINLFKPGAILINTSRGKHVDTEAVLRAVDDKRIAGVGLDVYEHEHDLFFEDHSETGCADSLFNELRKKPNVMITCHQAFFTETALANIAKTTVDNIQSFIVSGKPLNEVLT